MAAGWRQPWAAVKADSDELIDTWRRLYSVKNSLAQYTSLPARRDCKVCAVLYGVAGYGGAAS